jgi:hypothetical protein
MSYPSDDFSAHWPHKWAAIRHRRHESGWRLGLRLVAVIFDPGFDVIELEAQVSAEPIVGDRVVVTLCGAPVMNDIGTRIMSAT